MNKFDSLPSDLLREISILKDSKHENILSLLDVSVSGEKIYLIFEALDIELGDYIVEETPSMHMIKTDCTYEYTSPEQLLSAPYSFPIDIWAVGCIFAQMVKGGDTLLMYNRELAAVASISRVFGTPHEKTWPGVTQHSPSLISVSYQSGQGLAQEVLQLDSVGLDLLSKLLALDPQKRITAEDALKHPFFNDLAPLQTPRSCCFQEAE